MESLRPFSIVYIVSRQLTWLIFEWFLKPYHTISFLSDIPPNPQILVALTISSASCFTAIPKTIKLKFCWSTGKFKLKDHCKITATGLHSANVVLKWTHTDQARQAVSCVRTCISGFWYKFGQCPKHSALNLKTATNFRRNFFVTT